VEGVGEGTLGILGGKAQRGLFQGGSGEEHFTGKSIKKMTGRELGGGR